MDYNRSRSKKEDQDAKKRAADRLQKEKEERDRKEKERKEKIRQGKINFGALAGAVATLFLLVVLAEIFSPWSTGTNLVVVALSSLVVWALIGSSVKKVFDTEGLGAMFFWLSMCLLVLGCLILAATPSPPKPIPQSAPITRSPLITIPENAGWMTFKVTSEPQKAIRINGDCVFQYENANQVFLVKEGKGEAVYHNKTTPSCSRRQFKFFKIPPEGVDIYIYWEKGGDFELKFRIIS